jgi:hypothetical protein
MAIKMTNERKTEIRRTLKYSAGRMGQERNPQRKFKITNCSKGEIVQIANELLDELDRLEKEE